MDSLTDVLEKEAKLKIEKAVALEKALKGNDIDEIYRAQSYLKKIEQRDSVDNVKSMLVDPMDLSASFGYKDKKIQISYQVLRAMSKVHVVKAIIETRKDQVLSFCEPQKNKYSTGFVIAKKQKYTELKKETKLTKIDEKKIEWLIEFLLSCGTSNNFWHGDTFDTFIGKIVQDSMTMDQATFEIVRNRKGDPVEFFHTDAATYRIAETYGDTEDMTRFPEKVVNGYLPSYVQLYQASIYQEFYPWELCFGVRNPSTRIDSTGYGVAELEDMISTVTGILNADSYNGNFFKVGSSPRGILKYSGNVNQNTLEDFRRQWLAQVAGVMNAHKIPIINADKLDFISTQMNNKDMEFQKYHEFLIKIACAVYKIDPSEIGFPMSGTTEGGFGLGGDNTNERLQFSRDKGLKPLLKKIQYWINKYLIWQIDPEYEFRFVGIEEDDKQTELDQDVTSLQNFMTLNEIRAKRNLDPIEGGDIPLNPVYLQAKGMEQQQQMEMEQRNSEDEEEPFGAEEDADIANSQSMSKVRRIEEDPFLKSLSSDIERLLCE